MSDIIYGWLNDEVQLSSRVTNFESDFANGYLFGELLAKYNQQLNFNLFSNKDLRNTKISNFNLLEPTFKTLKIEFNAQIADGILKQQKGIALKVLYRLKMALEKVHNPADIKTFDDTGKLNTIVPLKQIRPIREKYDTMESHLFSKRLNSLNKSQKQIDLEKKLSKFTDNQARLDEEARKKIQEDQDRDRMLKEEHRKIELNKLQRAITFNEDWQSKGWAEHSKNMSIQKAREEHDRKFAEQTATKIYQKKLQASVVERNEVLEQLDYFESNATKLGIELEKDPSKSQKMERSAFLLSPTTLSKFKEQTMKSDAARKERDKRRRKMIVDQASAQRGIEIKKRENILLEKLEQQSKQENEIGYEVWRATQCKDIIIENRKLRDEEYEKKQESQIALAETKEAHLLDQLIEENERDMHQKMVRQRELNIHQLSEKRLDDYRTCKDFFNYIFEVADLCYQHQQDNDTQEIDPRFWLDCCNLFTETKSLIPRNTFRDSDATENLQKELEPEIKESTQQLALDELNDYLNGNGAWKPVHNFDAPKDEDDATYIPNKPLNNYKLGELVANIIDMSYPQEEVQAVPADIPNHLPLKLLSLGQDFSGKETLTTFLKEKYDIQVLQMKDILDEALEKSNQEEEEAQVAEQAEQDGEIVPAEKPAESLRTIGVAIKECLAKGEEVPDELYIRAVVLKIKEFYPALTHEELLQEIQEMQGAEDAQGDEQIEQNGESNASFEEAPSSAERTGRSATKQKKSRSTKGWILTGYPNNYEQVKGLEKALSGFITADEKGSSEAETRKERAEIVVRPPAKEIVTRKLIRGGIDAAIILDVPKEECVRRAVGRRIDPETGIVYHLEDNLPPTNQSPLIERLISINNPENSEASLIDKLTKYDKNKDDIEKWLSMFGIEELKTSCLQKFNGFGNREDVHAQVAAHLEMIIEHKMKEYGRILDEAQQSEERKRQEEEDLLRQQQEDARMALVDQQIILESLDRIKQQRIAELTIPKELLSVLNSMWEAIQNNYINSSTSVFGEIKKQRNFISVRLAELQKRYLENVQNTDERMLVILDFQKEYNKFVEENPDMIEENDIKEELHQRVEDLYQQLWEMIEKKKDDLIEERKAIMNSGYIEDEMELFVTNIQRLIQTELDRYFGCIQVSQDYYNTLEGKDLTETPENIVFDLLPKADNLPPIEDLESATEPFPRLELLYKNAVKILNGEEIEDPSVQVKDPQKGGKAPVVKKEDAKKPAAAAGKKEKEAAQEEEKKELTPLEKELKQTINTEKAIMRYRLYVIKNLAINTIKEMRGKAKSLYNKFEDWLNYSVKAENDAIFSLTNLLGEAIENQEKIQNELQLHYVDVIKSYKYFNFETPPVIPLPAKELLQPNRFTITQLKAILGQLSTLTSTSGILDNQVLLQFLHQRTVNSLSRDELPHDWRNTDFIGYQRLIKNLDRDCKGYIHLKSLGTHLCLLSTPLPKEEDLLEYQTDLMNHSRNGWIDRENFLRCPAFFDGPESSPQFETNSIEFERSRLLKDILFDLNKKEELMDISEYVKILSSFKKIPEPAEQLSDNNSNHKLTPIAESPLKSPKKKAKREEQEESVVVVVKTYNNVLFD